MIEGISCNTSLEALTIKSSRNFTYSHGAALVQALDAEIPTKDTFEEMSDVPIIKKRIEDLLKILKHGNALQENVPPPLKGRATTPLKYLDLSGNKLSFDFCVEIQKYLSKTKE